jgi:hypothetical protein
MKKTKVENVSGIKLDFFLKQNKQDVRVVLKPGETSWCDLGTTTKSMILYERKNLIKSSIGSSSTIIAEVAANVNNDEVLDKLHTTEDIEYIQIPGVDPPEFTPDTTELLTPLEKATKETEEYKKESEKTYKGKKRGRKKKRGPKPGSKRKKSGDNPSPESQS